MSKEHGKTFRKNDKNFRKRKAQNNAKESLQSWLKGQNKVTKSAQNSDKKPEIDKKEDMWQKRPKVSKAV